MDVIKNSTLAFDITPYLNSRGWSIDSSGKAVHISITEGDLEFTKYKLLTGNVYEYSLTVEDLLTGSTLDIVASGTVINTVSSDGYIQGTFTAIGDGYITLRSAGDLKVSQMQVKLLETSTDNLANSTITWSEDRKKWITFKDFIPECGFSMYTKMYTIKDGALYVHDNTDLYNNFYGVQYESRIKFPVASVGVKTYNSIAVHSNKVIGTTENGIETQLGQVSDLISFDFETKEGIHYANLLRDEILNDKLKGRYIVVELTDEDSPSTKLQIFKIVLKSVISTINE